MVHESQYVRVLHGMSDLKRCPQVEAARDWGVCFADVFTMHCQADNDRALASVYDEGGGSRYAVFAADARWW